jgi:hypothetical protein
MELRLLGDFNLLFELMWFDFFKKPLDTLPKTWRQNPHTGTSIEAIVRKYFFTCEWYEVYDFVEFVANNYPATSNYCTDKRRNENFMGAANSILEKEMSAYRFVSGQIVQITSEEEIGTIEEAIETTETWVPVIHHLKSALNFLADRKTPNYRNSIKESISSVESMCKLIAEDDKATLGTALKKLEGKVTLHPALKKAFDSLYGYTNDADGIRHALLDEPNLKFEDAKFMLVACSAFINYLQAKLI